MAKYTKKQRKHLKSKSGKKNKTGKRLKRSGKKLIGGGVLELTSQEFKDILSVRERQIIRDINGKGVKIIGVSILNLSLIHI